MNAFAFFGITAWEHGRLYIFMTLIQLTIHNAHKKICVKFFFLISIFFSPTRGFHIYCFLAYVRITGGETILSDVVVAAVFSMRVFELPIHGILLI